MSPGAGQLLVRSDRRGLPAVDRRATARGPALEREAGLRGGDGWGEEAAEEAGDRPPPLLGLRLRDSRMRGDWYQGFAEPHPRGVQLRLENLIRLEEGCNRR